MVDCPHGFPSPRSCWTCMEDGNLPPVTRSSGAAPSVEAVFTAAFDGQCSDCNLPVYVGQKIARMSDETYRHHLCVTAKGLF